MDTASGRVARGQRAPYRESEDILVLICALKIDFYLLIFSRGKVDSLNHTHIVQIYLSEFLSSVDNCSIDRMRERHNDMVTSLRYRLVHVGVVG